ncbi:N-acetylneuraminate synthase [Prochlorococcus sp. MIT 0602]|nr:N-acetylneuraminate synthase [Prochlorococcus sp. MIT 0602]
MRSDPFVIAEIGCNHKGSLEIAKKLVLEAKAAGATCAKFQKRNVKESLRPEIYTGPHPNPHNSYGDTYGKHREYLELTDGEHIELKEYCEQNSIHYSCTPFDLTSAKFLVSLNLKHIKVASFHNNHEELIDYLCKNQKGMIHISLGMITEKELNSLEGLLTRNNKFKDTVLYLCTSNYPCSFEDLHLEHITYLLNRFKDKCHAIGFSGHHNGIAVDLCAYTLGATYFERHFTLDRTWKGTDHAASLEPGGLRKLIRDLKAAQKSLTKRPSGVLESERHNRSFHKHINSNIDFL